MVNITKRRGLSGWIGRYLENWMIGRAPLMHLDRYLLRWSLLPGNRRRDWFNLYLHRFTGSDHPVPHDHPYRSVSIILSGRYVEHYADGTSDVRRPGDVVIRGARELHWIEILDRPVWTLFVHGRRVREWGFLHPRHGWITQEVYQRDYQRSFKQ